MSGTEETEQIGELGAREDISETNESLQSIDSSITSIKPEPVEITHNDNDAAPQISTTTTKEKPVPLPKSERRGLLSFVTLIAECKDSRSYSERVKYFIVFIIALASMIGPMGTSIILPAIEDIKAELHTSTMMVNVAVGIYLMSLGVFPLWWSSASERFGRRSIYLISFTLYTGFGVGCALAPTIDFLIGFRILSGGCSASVQAVGAGTIADLYAPEERGRGMGWFYLGPLMAPLLSPIIGSLLLTRWNWRSTQWFLVILSGGLTVMILFLLPETLRLQDNKALIKKILEERRNRKANPDEEKQDAGQTDADNENQIVRMASRISKSEENDQTEPLPDGLFRYKTDQNDPRLPNIIQNDLIKIETEINKDLDSTKYEIFKKECYSILVKPIKSVNFLKYPPVALAISYSAVSFGILYLVNMTIEYEFARPPYNWKSLYVGFAYIPNSVSYIFASIFGGRWTDYLYKKYKQKHGYPVPEARISYNILSAVICFPIALLIIGWCFDKHTFWVSPLVGTAIFGYASMMTIGPTVTYLVDSLPGRGATGVALNNLVRQILATIAVFVVEPIIKGMGTGPMFSMFAGIVTLWAVVLIVLKRRGDYWRENYDLQKLYDSLD